MTSLELLKKTMKRMKGLYTVPQWQGFLGSECEGGKTLTMVCLLVPSELPGDWTRSMLSMWYFLTFLGIQVSM